VRLAHAPAGFDDLRRPTVDVPLRVLVSGCLAGLPCGVDGTDYGLGDILRPLLRLPILTVRSFCPEDFAFGTPRTTPDIHGGDGHDVLDGNAKVLDELGNDLSAKMIAGAKAMLEVARAHRTELALLTDMSAACGSQVISDGSQKTNERRFRPSVGVATALLLRNGISVVSQRDAKTLRALRSRLDPELVQDAKARDHHETDWYIAAFGA
jgi:uncharacterized protein YbbK (DUF523 family)